MSTKDPDLQRLLDREAIADVLVRYCHGIDRLDRAILESTYWPDAYDDHMTFKGSAPEFIDWVLEFLKPIKTQHFIGNSWIQFSDTEHAFGETYVIAFHQTKALFGLEEMVAGVRYLDRFEKRGNEWRLSERILALDYARLTAGADLPRYDQIENKGGRAPNDPFYKLFNGLLK